MGAGFGVLHRVKDEVALAVIGCAVHGRAQNVVVLVSFVQEEGEHSFFQRLANELFLAIELDFQLLQGVDILKSDGGGCAQIVGDGHMGFQHTVHIGDNDGDAVAGFVVLNAADGVRQILFHHIVVSADLVIGDVLEDHCTLQSIGDRLDGLHFLGDGEGMVGGIEVEGEFLSL